MIIWWTIPEKKCSAPALYGMTAVGQDREQPHQLFKQNAWQAIFLVSFDGKYRAYIQNGAINPKFRTRKSGQI